MKNKSHYRTVIMVVCSILLMASSPKESKFDIYEYAWLAGSWHGEGFGGITEEIWSPPSADGTMVGLFRLTKADGSVMVYQFFLLDKTGLKVKHFTSKLIGWEDKENTTDFKMISLTKDKIELEGLTYRLKSRDEMEVQLEMEQGGKTETETFTQKRKN